MDALDASHGAPRAVDADHPQAQRPGALRDRAADVAESDDRHRLSGESLRQDVFAPAPLALGGAIGLRALRDRQTPAQHVLPHPGAEDTRHAGDDHVIGKRGNERPVDAGAHGLQPAQPRRTGIEVGRKLPRIQHVRVGDGRRGLRRRRARHHVQASAAR